ncbi:uncharacterized protein LOC133843102 isoform X3 [Drosophila sulfurigaster albostrigata]|uniref:uncharacterized protein LOC133843102 isoform X3 n=1 Tax=Drosophila sulfurigaster albostrigata TaxID=89887 RepID=UPI002D21CACB|nr:uncharacterized protein LOC133843102 isoform X3 [Drosophila sulfurigaster albostrigata]
MMKRTRIDEVQFGTRTGPGPGGGVGVGGVGVGGVGVGVAGSAANSAGGGVVNSAGGVTIGTVVPNAHSATISSINSIHHRILTPQHGGAQTIAYLPSTTPTAATNLKTTSSSSNTANIVDSASTGAQTTAVVPVGVGGVVVSTGSAATQTLQYTTSYSVASIQAGGTLKASPADSNAVQIHVTGGAVAPGGGSQTVSSSCQTAGTIRQRTISGTQTNASSVGGNLTTTAQQTQPPTTQSQQQTPPNGPGVGAVGAGAAAAAGNSTPPQGGGQLAGGSAAAPRLKVEDALSYLDQVKYQYADQPQIYNNFLDIMKEFKSHCIDTPGVIERVSTLFKGHAELIYGFNMFLPPGYKIEMQHDALGFSVPVVSMPSPPGAPSSTGTVHMIAGAGNSPLAAAANVNAHTTTPTSSLKPTALAQTPGPPVGGAAAASVAAVPQIQTAGAVNLMTHGGASLTQTTIHALQPAAGAAQSPGGGHVHVTSSSTTVPPAGVGGVGVSVSAHNIPQNYSRDRGEQRATITPTGPASVPAPGGASIVVGGGPPTPNSLSELSPHAAAAGQHNLHHIQQAHQSILLGETTGQQNQPVEFNHAITYVNKIKHRYQSQPAKYKKFLEILHAYQKEQKVMKESSGGVGGGAMTQDKMLTEQEVYTQVAKLFGQDEDLLREFGQFLPDATNHQSSAAAAAAAQYMSKSALHNDHHKKQQQQQQSVQQQRTTTTATLSGGAHISMSSASPSAVPNSGSPLHLSSGATLSQIDSSSAHAHAAAIGNLSAVNTSVSIKSCGVQQNHIISSSGGSIFEKEYHGLGQQQQQQQQQQLQQQQHRGLPPHLQGGQTAAGLRGTATGGAMLDQRNNHHAQKYVAQHPHQNMSQKKSPSYGGGNMANANMPHHHHLGENSLDRNSPNIASYVTPAQLPPHPHHNAHNSSGGSNRQRQVDELSTAATIGSSASSTGGPPPAKRPKPYCRDVSFSEASRKCTISDAAFFDKVRKALRNPEVYDNFLRCLTLFNQEIVSKTELLVLVSPFLVKFPDLLRWFTDFLGPPMSGQLSGAAGAGGLIDGLPLAATQRQGSNSSSHDRASSHQSTDYVQDVDLSLCKRLGASYCALPQSTVPKKCSGRTALCREVLNDKWVSFPTWASEDSTFVTSRKTQFEETIYRNIHRTEDERFELDLVIEVNSATIRVLENVQKKMSRMSPEELAKYHLDDHLGGTSQTIHQRAIHRIYGDKSGEIIQGMKKNPSVAVPIVLKRLKVKEEEWRDAQKSFNKQWREQNEKYYLKSLDHQAINFKPNDMKALRSKSLFNEIETLYDERHDQEDDAMEAGGPHLVLPYKDKTILDDAANLLIHHVKRQTGIQKQEKQKIKQIIRQFVPDLFFAPRQPLSDDERDDDDTKMDVDSPLSRCAPKGVGTPSSEGASPARSNASSSSSSNNANNATANSAAVAASIKKESEEAKATTGATASSDDATPSTSTAAAAAAATSSSSATAGDAKDNKAESEEGATKSNNNSSLSATGASPRRPEDAAAAASAELSVKQEQVDFANPPLLPAHAQGQRENESYSLFFANNNWYLFMRLHAILCDRLHVMYERARLLAIEEERCRVNRRESTATALRLKPKPDVQVEDYYPTFLDMLKNVLDGNMDSNTFEDTMREMFGIYAYISFTLDKVVSNAVRQLQYCVTERAALDCVELYASEQRRGSTGGFCREAHKSFEREMGYQRKAESILNEENCFKVYIYKIDCRVTIELLDSESEETEKPAVLKAQKFSKYVERLANPALGGGVGGSGGGGGGSGGNNATSGNDNMVESTDIKMEEEEENAELVRGARKARFLLRNKRRSQLHEEQVRQLFEQKRHCGAASEANPPSTDGSATPNSNNNNNTNTNNNNSSSWNKRAPERLGAAQLGLAEQYAFHDRDEISTNASNGRCFVTSKNLNLLKYDAVRRAKKSHCRVTQLKYKRFQSYVNKWLQQHVSEQSQQHCSDWLLGKTPEQINASGWGATSKTKSLQQKDTTKTPYRIYTRYKVLQPTSSSNNSSISNIATAATAALPATVAAVAATATAVVSVANNAAAASTGSSLLNAAETTTTTNAPQQHCNSAAAAATAGGNAETGLQQVRPMES